MHLYSHSIVSIGPAFLNAKSNAQKLRQFSMCKLLDAYIFIIKMNFAITFFENEAKAEKFNSMYT